MSVICTERKERNVMAVKCSDCGEGSYKVIDRETDSKGRTFLLLECQKCARTIIVPAEERNEEKEV